ncbi:MAG: hypothetical protein A4S09_07600 [Proteobacteria bacterium SG_bin7]|nr:MAG: hypothetical protein A4S09_07600 [Proteobacteria bacterium SG_bin7]
MKVHRPQSEIIVKCLRDIFENKYLADKVVNIQLKSQKQMGARDRRFVAESVYEVVRWWRLLKHVAENSGFDKKNPWIWYGVYLVKSGFELPNWREFEVLKGFTFPNESVVGSFPFAVRESIPDWMDELGRKEVGERWGRVVEALNKPADVVLRVNQLKTTPSELIPALLSEGVEVKPIDGDALLLLTRKNLFTTVAYQAGLFEIQDWSSQQIVPFLGVKPGERVIDACAGAGGKTLHMAAMMKNKGRIVAMDIYEKKLEELRRRKNRAGVDIVETKTIETKTIKRLAESADRLLLDVPCSGLGVLRRKPDSKWKLALKKISELNGLQREIVFEYSAMVKKGGTLVYSTCSILPSENGDIVKDFVAKTSLGFKLMEEKTLLPDDTGFDGFYMAKFVRE